jgi:two-component system cell cycle sensor histidine kinase PleC
VPAGVRIAVFSALLLLAIYTLLVIMRMQAQTPPSAAPAAAVGQANLAASRVENQISVLRTALNAAAEARRRLGGEPLDLAETALAAAQGEAQATAVASDGEVQGTAGGGVRPDAWRAVIEAATRSGKSFWVGPVKGGGRFYYSAVLSAPGTGVGGQGRLAVLAAADAAALIHTNPGGAIQIVATRDGPILASSGADGAQQASTLAEALSVTPANLAVGADGAAQAHGTLPSGVHVQVVIRAVGDSGLVMAVATPAAPALLSSNMRNQGADLFALLAPLAVGCGLAIVLVGQSRRSHAAQQAMAISEERFRLAVEAARCGIWEWDLKADRVFMSDITGVILGWGGGGAASGQEVLARISSDHRDRVRQALTQAGVYGAFDVSFRVPNRHGKSAWIDARGQGFGQQDGGGYQRIIGVALDVTEERIFQARAQAAETRLRDAIESVSEAFVLWDRSGRLLLCNRNYRDLFSLEPRLLKPGAPRETVERHARLAIKQEQPAPAAGKGMREAELNNGRWIQISERRTADGGLVMTAADITAIKTQEEARRLNEEALQRAVTGLEASQSELAELARKYEAEKIRAESANKAKSEFLANMSHELRTPLNAINGFSEIMQTELFGPLGDPRYKEYAGDILNSGQHLLAVINDILDMSKIEAGKMNLKFEQIDLQEVAEDAVRLIRNRAEAAGLTVVIDMPNLPEVEADFRALKQVLLNLLSNAVKFTPRGGQIRVFGRAGSDRGGAQRVQVGVQDTGIGISKADLARLAKPFEQVESQHAKTQQGTGLGLALTKSLVEMHGGLLDMKSEPGQGTTVSFVLAVRQAAPAAVSAA